MFSTINEYRKYQDAVWEVMESYRPSSKSEFLSLYYLVKGAELDPENIDTSNLSDLALCELHGDGFDCVFAALSYRHQVAFQYQQFCRDHAPGKI